MIDGVSTLEGTEVIERGPFRVTVWISGRNVEVVEHLSLLDEGGVDVHGQVPEQLSGHVAPRLLFVGQMHGLTDP
jgi:hypothetical protein